MTTNTAKFSNSLTQMLTGRSGGMVFALNVTGNGFTHGQQVGWHGNQYILYSVKLSDGRWVIVGQETSNGALSVKDSNFINACEWGNGKQMSQNFDQPNGTENLSGLNLKKQFEYPTQWYPGQTYPGTVNATPGSGSGSTNTGGNSGGTGGGNPGGTGGNPGGTGFLPSGLLGGNKSTTGTGDGGTTNTLVMVIIVAAVAGLVYYLVKKK